ncbi:MAG: 7-cyano-7-deazaguanine synthase [Proteobacteria bacterium]|jgi:7-cyano-7-deazaguanine synthase|nr:7-cyano-7-deazaguanine synthase [Pseudomonadota bacterium]
MPDIVEILWTGGYDSTFRIAQLSRKNVVIQPYYLSDKRPSEPNELHAIQEITADLQANLETKCTFLPLRIIGVEERKTAVTVSEAFRHLKSQTYMGSQYEWLGTFALDHPGLELSIHKDDKAIALIKKHGALKRIHDANCDEDTYVIDKDASSPEVNTLFGHFRFPLAELTKLDMKKSYRQMGLEALSNKTWFCYTPIQGKPCGHCHPCQYTIEEGLRDRFTTTAYIRYLIYGKLRPMLANIPALRKLKNRICRKH